ncbi:hypothetical protein PMAYCL1PPCAC_00584, partial [Pristionchus mayeri]
RSLDRPAPDGDGRLDQSWSTTTIAPLFSFHCGFDRPAADFCACPRLRGRTDGDGRMAVSLSGFVECSSFDDGHSTMDSSRSRGRNTCEKGGDLAVSRAQSLSIRW